MSDAVDPKPEEKKAEEPPFDRKRFWKFYDDYQSSNFRDAEINAGLSKQLARNYANIHSMERPERGWKDILGWIALHGKDYMNKIGSHVALTICRGDVMIQQNRWDRDVLVTHSPLNANMVSGAILRSYHGEAVGLWLPIYDPNTLRIAIDMRLNEMRGEMFAFLAAEKAGWTPFVDKKPEKKKH